jgi:hypothetical protein
MDSKVRKLIQGARPRLIPSVRAPAETQESRPRKNAEQNSSAGNHSVTKPGDDIPDDRVADEQRIRAEKQEADSAGGEREGAEAKHNKKRPIASCDKRR